MLAETKRRYWKTLLKEKRHNLMRTGRGIVFTINSLLLFLLRIILAGTYFLALLLPSMLSCRTWNWNWGKCCVKNTNCLCVECFSCARVSTFGKSPEQNAKSQTNEKNWRVVFIFLLARTRPIFSLMYLRIRWFVFVNLEGQWYGYLGRDAFSKYPLEGLSAWLCQKFCN